MAPKLAIKEGYLGLYDAQMPGENIFKWPEIARALRFGPNVILFPKSLSNENHEPIIEPTKNLAQPNCAVRKKIHWLF